jgi:hypothetical protein
MWSRIVASRSSSASGEERPSLGPVAWSASEADALDQAVELALHYRDRHVSSGRGAPRVEVCRCPRFDPAGEPYEKRLHAEIQAAFWRGGQQELLHTLETASGRAGLAGKEAAAAAA